MGGSDDALTTQERILQAAERVFAEQGALGARTRQIAAAAGVNVAQLHYHFGSKEDLYEAVLRRALRQLAERLQGALQDASVTSPDGVARAVRAHFDLLASRPHMVRLMMDALLRRDERVFGVVRETLLPTLLAALSSLAAGGSDGALRAVDPLHTLVSAVGLNTIYFVARPLLEEVLGEGAYAPEALLARREAVVDLLLNGVVERGEASR